MGARVCGRCPLVARVLLWCDRVVLSLTVLGVVFGLSRGLPMLCLFALLLGSITPVSPRVWSFFNVLCSGRDSLVFCSRALQFTRVQT